MPERDGAGAVRNECGPYTWGSWVDLSGPVLICDVHKHPANHEAYDPAVDETNYRGHCTAIED